GVQTQCLEIVRHECRATFAKVQRRRMAMKSEALCLDSLATSVETARLWASRPPRCKPSFCLLRPDLLVPLPESFDHSLRFGRHGLRIFRNPLSIFGTAILGD